MPMFSNFIIEYHDNIESNSNVNVTKKTTLQQKKLHLFPSQFRLFFKRALIQVFHDGRSMIVLNVLVILSATLIGLLYRHFQFIGPPSYAHHLHIIINVIITLFTFFFRVENILKCPSSFQFLCAQNQEDSYLVQALLISLSLGLVAGINKMISPLIKY